MTAFREGFGFQPLPDPKGFCDEWVRNIVLANIATAALSDSPPPAAPPTPTEVLPPRVRALPPLRRSPLDMLRTALKVIKPWCSECRREVAEAEVRPSEMADVIFIDVRCHGSEAFLSFTGKALAVAGCSPRAFIDLVSQPVPMYGKQVL